MRYISFDKSTIPAKILNHFSRYGRATLWLKDENVLCEIWDIELFLFLSNPRTIDGLSFRYYSDFDWDFSKPSEIIEDTYVQSCRNKFMEGYRKTYNNAFFMKELEHKIFPLSNSDENIKRYTLVLYNEIYDYDIRFSNTHIDEYNNFQKLGEKHGFKTLLYDIIEKHNWLDSINDQNKTVPDNVPSNSKGRKKSKGETISPSELEELNKRLIEVNIITEGKLNDNCRQIIAHLITLLQNKFDGSRNDILNQLRPLLNINNKLTDKDFKILDNRKNQENIKTADQIYISVFRTHSDNMILPNRT
jgi:hypothetical protein